MELQTKKDEFPTFHEANREKKNREMDLNQEIKAQLDQNEAANMLAKVGLSLQDCSTERDLQLLVADYR